MTFRGVSTHTGTAKGKLVNPVRMLADFVASLPPELAPETTEGYEGFVHPHEAQADAEKARCVLILRDHDWEKLQGHKALARAARRGGGRAASRGAGRDRAGRCSTGT